MIRFLLCVLFPFPSPKTEPPEGEAHTSTLNGRCNNFFEGIASISSPTQAEPLRMPRRLQRTTPPLRPPEASTSPPPQHGTVEETWLVEKENPAPREEAGFSRRFQNSLGTENGNLMRSSALSLTAPQQPLKPLPAPTSGSVVAAVDVGVVDQHIAGTNEDLNRDVRRRHHGAR